MYAEQGNRNFRREQRVYHTVDTLSRSTAWVATQSLAVVVSMGLGTLTEHLESLEQKKMVTNTVISSQEYNEICHSQYHTAGKHLLAIDNACVRYYQDYHTSHQSEPDISSLYDFTNQDPHHSDNNEILVVRSCTHEGSRTPVPYYAPLAIETGANPAFA